MAAAFGVYAMRAVGVGFTADGIGPGGGVDDQLRSGLRDGPADEAGVADVRFSVTEG